MLKIYTDGAAVPNPGLGSYAFIVTSGNTVVYESVGSRDYATNNEMEYMGVISAIEWCQSNCKDEVLILSDSQYVVNSMNSWCLKWKAKGWKNGKDPIKNLDLVIRCHGLMLQNTNVKLAWIRGHNGNVFNDRADELCALKLNSIRGVCGV